MNHFKFQSSKICFQDTIQFFSIQIGITIQIKAVPVMKIVSYITPDHISF